MFHQPPSFGYVFLFTESNRARLMVGKYAATLAGTVPKISAVGVSFFILMTDVLCTFVKGREP